jgi:hypothetical protein
VTNILRCNLASKRVASRAISGRAMSSLAKTAFSVSLTGRTHDGNRRRWTRDCWRHTPIYWMCCMANVDCWMPFS